MTLPHAGSSSRSGLCGAGYHGRYDGTRKSILYVAHIERTILLYTPLQAVLRLDSSPENIGIIISASRFATKLFGYPVASLERRSINMLLPSPLAEVLTIAQETALLPEFFSLHCWSRLQLHDGFMKRYLVSGQGRIVGYTRVVIAKHRNSCIFPLILSVK
jgi:PAS domain-containing protein